MSADPGASRESAGQRDEDGRAPRVDGSAGVQAGSGNVQFNIFYGNPARASAALGDDALARLAGALGAGRWREADLLTELAMKMAVGRGAGEYLSDDDLRAFPSEALSAIDQLWHGHSGGRFGFSAQLAIWEELGALGIAPPADGDVEREFGSRVGWLVAGRWLSYEQYTFDLSAPPGHLPRFAYRHPAGWWLGESCLICTRLRVCS